MKWPTLILIQKRTTYVQVLYFQISQQMTPKMENKNHFEVTVSSSPLMHRYQISKVKKSVNLNMIIFYVCVERVAAVVPLQVCGVHLLS